MGRVDEYLAWQRDYNDLSADRLTSVRRVLAKLEAHAGVPAEDVTEQQLAAFMHSRSAEGMHPNTVRKEGNMVKPFFTWCWEQRVIDADRLMRIKRVPNPRGATARAVPRPYSRKEIGQLWQDLDAQYPRADRFVARWLRGTSRWPRVWRHAMGLQVNAITMLALHAGMRRNEIFNAKLDDIHPDNAYVVVSAAARKGAHPGDDRTRQVPMTVDLRSALAEWLAFRDIVAPSHGSPWLVVSPYVGSNNHIPSHPFNPMGARRFSELMSGVGRGWELHRLRHTCGTEWLRAGMELEMVSRLLGHATLSQTLGYAQIVHEDVKTSALRVEDKFARALARPTPEAA